MKSGFFKIGKYVAILTVLLSMMLMSLLAYASITQVPSITSLDAFTSIPVPPPQNTDSSNASIPTHFDTKQLGIDLPVNIGLEYLQGGGVVLDGQYSKQFTDNWATSILGQYGADLYRVNATAGLLIGSNNLFKVTVERLSTVLPFQFDSGGVNQRVNQNAVGARYQIGFDLSFINAINAGGYYAQAMSVNLPTVIFVNNGLSYTNSRNIAGSTSGGGDVGIISSLGEKTQLDTHVYYDRVNYATQFSSGSQYNAAGLGASAGLTRIITPRTKLILNAESRKIYDSLQVALAFLPKFFSQYNMQFSVNAARFIPHNSIPSSNSIGAQLAFNLEKDLQAANAHYALDNPAAPSLQSWTSMPAVYMEQVLAVAEQETVLSVPAITAITPSSGPVGTNVTISGNGFMGATTVALSGTSIPFTLVNNSTITFTAPVGALGARNVSVTTPGGTDTVINGFTYTLTLNQKQHLQNPSQAPAITNISPTTGIANTLVTITGTNLDGAISVAFGVINGAIQSVSPTQITVRAPPGNTGTVNITVTTDGGSSPATPSFTYASAPPVINNYSPNSGSTLGGTNVTINGSGFTGTSAVTFGGTAAASFTVVNDTQITAVTPARTQGPASVQVTNPLGTATAGTVFTYIPPPTITNINPSSGSTAGGTSVTITGTTFIGGATTVTFGGDAGTNVNVLSGTELTVDTPAHASGAVDVVVTTTGGSDTESNGFTYVGPPTISTIDPNEGPIAGGTSVTITGTDFVDGATNVTFDGDPGANITVLSATELTVDTPAHAAGAVDVVVTTAEGSATEVNGFTYLAAPTVDSAAPTTGSTAGGTTVTLAGTNFVDGGTSVTFGGNAGTNIIFVNSTEITVDTPAHAAGAVDIVVTTAGGTDTLTNGFTYIAAPVITSIDPDVGPVGDQVVTITGSGFTDATLVTFGVASGHTLNVISDTELQVTAPGQPAGPVDVVVVTPYGSSAPSTYIYAAPPEIHTIDPAEGPPAGGTTVTITGANFINGNTAPLTVSFGASAGTNLNVISDTELTVDTPAHGGGAVDVVVTTGGGSATATNGFNYIAPTIDSISPPSGPTAGGTTVTITGTNFVDGATTVTFGGDAGTTVNVVSATELTVDAPAHAAGAVDVVVTTPDGSVTAVNAYTYLNAPTIATITPSSGPTAGGTTVTITGTNFVDGGTGVGFDGVPGVNVTFISSTEITVDTPAHAAGAVNVMVITGGGSDTETNGFTYREAPTIDSVDPVVGPVAGGTTVTITGTNFVDGGTSITFGGDAGTNITFVSSTEITVDTPAHAAGEVDVVVTTTGGSATATNGFTYIVVPVITSIDPDVGPISDQVVTITGSGFTDATSVMFGDFSGHSLNVISDTELQVTAPGQIGEVNVVVNTPYSASAPSPYIYAAAPEINTIDPVAGAPGGGTTVTITGANFISGDTTPLTVSFGGSAGTSVNVISDTELTVVTPAHAAGAVDVVVTTGGGSATATNGFTYAGSPTIDAVSPTEGPVAGGDTVTITGTNFANGGTTVTFGGTPGTNVTVVSPTELTVDTPAHAAGDVNVVVTTPIGSATETNGYTYVAAPSVTTVTPSSGPESGGTTVTINGTNFIDGGTTVTFGGDDGTNITFVSSTQITVDTPAHAAGAVDVVVTTVGGSDTEVNGFTYVGTPAITSIDPDAGSAAGGDTVTLQGSGFTGTTSVTFDGDAGTSINVVNDSQLTVVTPAHAVGSVDVVVTSSGGVSAPGTYTYADTPTVTSVTPNSGSTAGGTSVVITGTLFNGATAVTFGGVNATSYVVNSATQITAIVPASASTGSVHVRVTTNTGTSSTSSSDLFTYTLPNSILVTSSSFSAANITPITGFGGGISSSNSTESSSESSSGDGSQAPAVALSPAKGSMKGGTKVSIEVPDAKGVTAVQFGGSKATSFSVDGNTITAVTPPAQHAGAVAVTITKSNSSISTSKGFTYTK